MHELENPFLDDWPSNEITLLDRREIQAPIAACLIREFAAVMGMEIAMKIALSAISKDARMAGMELARNAGSNSLKELGSQILNNWSQGGAMTIDLLEETESTLSFNVTRCRYAEMYERLGIKDLGFCLSCSRDEPLVKGFNQRIKLVRTSTIMEGAEYCDFRYVQQDGEAV
ncbi:MAG: L-2-amino-thiazoline-4-carboxylic acid hydrolase [Anaerolineales bacterium]|nr:L-2-amino-thiazoline-4-carboxylic acid hydrolase [Anaerolineales bacterium]